MDSKFLTSRVLFRLHDMKALTLHLVWKSLKFLTLLLNTPNSLLHLLLTEWLTSVKQTFFHCLQNKGHTDYSIYVQHFEQNCFFYNNRIPLT